MKAARPTKPKATPRTPENTFSKSQMVGGLEAA